MDQEPHKEQAVHGFFSLKISEENIFRRSRGSCGHHPRRIRRVAHSDAIRRCLRWDGAAVIPQTRTRLGGTRRGVRAQTDEEMPDASGAK